MKIPSTKNKIINKNTPAIAAPIMLDLVLLPVLRINFAYSHALAAIEAIKAMMPLDIM